jgi:formylmethanofuran dehydrogenase subunit E-like metal-binding protein
MTYKEFFIWLEGYLTGKLENKNIEIAPIIEKMGQVNVDVEIKKIILDHIHKPTNPIKGESFVVNSNDLSEIDKTIDPEKIIKTEPRMVSENFKTNKKYLPKYR